jgi:geranylgeranylglycerol-phosphate geranylgeranyltransferase
MTVADYVKMMRPLNSTMTGIGVIFAILVYNYYRLPGVLPVIIGFTTGFTAAAASMLVNDYVDRDVDSINKPWKPIPSGRVDPNTTLALSVILLVIAIIVNVTLGTSSLITAAIYSLVGYGYSFMRKYWWSHFIVSFSTTGPIVYGFIVAGMPGSMLPLMILFSITIFFVNTGREILKAIMDVEGDRKHGYSTIPIRYGIPVSRILMILFGIIGSITGITIGALGYAGIYYTMLITIAAIVYLYGLFLGYKYPFDHKRLEKGRRLTIYGMLIGLFAFLVAPVNGSPLP